MVATLQLKAPKLIVYFVSFTVVIFTILNIFPTREYYLMDNANNATTSNNTSYKSHLQHTYGRRTADIFHQCSKLIGKSSKSSCHISFLKCCRDFGLVPKGLRLKNPVSSDRSKAIFAKAETLLLTSELNGHKKSFSCYTMKIETLLSNLKISTNDTEFESISRLNSIKANSIMLSAIRTHGKKFQKLLDDSSLHFDSPYDTFLQYIERMTRQILPDTWSFEGYQAPFKEESYSC